MAKVTPISKAASFKQEADKLFAQASEITKGVRPIVYALLDLWHATPEQEREAVLNEEDGWNWGGEAAWLKAGLQDQFTDVQISGWIQEYRGRSLVAGSNSFVNERISDTACGELVSGIDEAHDNLIQDALDEVEDETLTAAKARQLNNKIKRGLKKQDNIQRYLTQSIEVLRAGSCLEHEIPFEEVAAYLEDERNLFMLKELREKLKDAKQFIERIDALKEVV